MKAKNVGDVLIKCGIYPGLLGFKYIEKFIEIVSTPEGCKMNTCDVYVQIAAEENAVGEPWVYKGKRTVPSGSTVERAIRHAVTDVACAECTPTFREIVDNVSAIKGSVTNSQFLYSLSRYCRLRNIPTSYTDFFSPSENRDDEVQYKQDQVRVKYLDLLLEREFPQFRRDMDACFD